MHYGAATIDTNIIKDTDFFDTQSNNDFREPGAYGGIESVRNGPNGPSRRFRSPRATKSRLIACKRGTRAWSRKRVITAAGRSAIAVAAFVLASYPTPCESLRASNLLAPETAAPLVRVSPLKVRQENLGEQHWLVRTLMSSPIARLNSHIKNLSLRHPKSLILTGTPMGFKPNTPLR